MILVSSSPEETEAIGQRLGALLNAGSFVALYGDLGGGKTCFVRGIIKALSPEHVHLVASPTYAIMHEYPGNIMVYHFDFYRLINGDTIIELGFDDYFYGKNICIAEWAERLGKLQPEDSLRITFEHAGDNLRKIHFDACGNDSRKVLAQLQSA